MSAVRDWEREYELDDEDRALLEHVLGDDRPPQGLHQGGTRPPPLHSRWERWEDEAVDDYLYPSGLDY